MKKQKDGSSTKIRFYKFVNPRTSVMTESEGVVAGDIIAQKTVKGINSLGITFNSFAIIMKEMKESMINAHGAQNELIDDLAQSALEPDPTDNLTPKKKKKSGFQDFIKPVVAGFFESLAKLGGWLFKAFISRAILKWFADPKNIEKMEKIWNGMMAFTKFLMKFVGGVVGNMLDGIAKVFDPNASWWEKIKGFGQFFVALGAGLLALRWLRNPLKLAKDFIWVLKTLYTNLVKGMKRMKMRKFGGKGGLVKGLVMTGATALTAMAVTSAMSGGSEETQEGGVPEVTARGDRTDLEKQQFNTMMEEKGFSKGGWISGPMSGYPVSLSGKGIDFIGHGTEYVATRAEGGKVNAQKFAGGGFVVPFNTPSTKSNPGLTSQRMLEASGMGFDLGGIYNTKNMPSFSEGGLIEGTNEEKWAKIKGMAEKAGAKYPNVVAAQFALESDWGRAVGAKNNFFGIKATPNEASTVSKTTEVVDGKSVNTEAAFKSFSSPQASIDHLVTQWYKDYKGYKGVNNAQNAMAAASMLKSEGYATDPAYASKLQQLISRYGKIDSIAPVVPRDKGSNAANITPGNTESLVSQQTATTGNAKVEAVAAKKATADATVTAATAIATSVSAKSSQDATNAALAAQGEGGSTIVVPMNELPEIIQFRPKFGLFGASDVG